MTILHVALGGALGAVLRYLCVSAAAFPYGTVLVNVLGSFAMGVLLIWLLESGTGHARWAPLLMTGVLGGFTTFSAFSLDALRLFEAGQVSGALAYVFGTVVLCLAAVAVGVMLGRGVMG
jgi:CrcB protein